MTNTVPAPMWHQERALEFIQGIGTDHSALFMEQGTGKTKVVIMMAMHLYNADLIDRLIVISPNAVTEQWTEEQFPEHCNLNHWLGIFWDGFSAKRDRERFAQIVNYPHRCLKVFATNVEAYQVDSIIQYIKMFYIPERTMVVIDESTKIKNGRRKSKGKRGGAKRTNVILDLFEHAMYKMILTGTPNPHSPFDLWSQFEFLHKNYFGMDYFQFEHHFGIMMKKTYQNRVVNTVLDEKTFNIVKNQLKQLEKTGQLRPEHVEAIAQNNGLKTSDVVRIRTMEKYMPYKNMDELKAMVDKVTFSIMKKDCLDLPDKVYEKLYVKMSNEQRTVYDTLKKEMYAVYDNKELTVTNKVVMALRLQMVSGGLFPYSHTEIILRDDGEEEFDISFKYKYIKPNPKIQTLLDDLETVSEDTFIIVWARFTGEILLIYESLIEAGYSADTYYGNRPRSVTDDFKAGKFRILIANPLKGGEGLNLQIATLHYYYSNSFKADGRLQSEDRSHRLGQTNKVTYKDIICKDSIDERVYAVLKMREDMINFFRSSSIKDILQ